MGRGRTKGSTNKAKANGASPGVGHNSELTDDQRHGLHLAHCRDYAAALEKKQKADAAFKNVSKMIKAEGDSVSKVKLTLMARTPEGEATIKAGIAQAAEVLRWSGVAVGETKDMFPTDRTPAKERAYAEGKRAGLDGKSAQPPHDPSTEQYRAWMDGHAEGQSILMQGFKPKAPEPKAGADDFEDSVPEGDASPEEIEAERERLAS